MKIRLFLTTRHYKTINEIYSETRSIGCSYQSISDTITFITDPILTLVSPILDFIFGPSPPSMSGPKLEIYPLFGPAAICFFSRTHAPFTIVLNKDVNSGRTLDNGKGIINFG